MVFVLAGVDETHAVYGEKRLRIRDETKLTKVYLAGKMITKAFGKDEVSSSNLLSSSNF